MILFLITFLSVFLLGFQQKNVMHDKYLMAMGTSFCIAFAQFTVYREAAMASPMDWVYMGIGGALGIVSSMYLHNRLRRRSSKKVAPEPSKV